MQTRQCIILWVIIAYLCAYVCREMVDPKMQAPQHVILLNCETILVAHHLTTSSDLISFSSFGCQMTEAQSRWGLTKLIITYNLENTVGVRQLKLWYIIPNILFALWIDRFTCLENLKSLVKVIPKSHSSPTSWIGASGASV